VTEPSKDFRTLTLMDTFKLYIWTMWKAGSMTDQQTANLLGFVDRLTDKQTADYCFAELDELKKREAFVYDGKHRQ